MHVCNLGLLLKLNGKTHLDGIKPKYVKQLWTFAYDLGVGACDTNVHKYRGPT